MPIGSRSVAWPKPSTRTAPCWCASGMAGYTGYLPKFTAAKTVGNSILCETAAGKIGINDYSPDAALDITTTFADTLWLRGPGTFTTNGRIRFQDTSPEVYIQNDIDGGLLLSVNENYGGRLAITGGNVGIGTLEPTSALSVAGDADFTGYVGIGTPNPNNALTVAGDADFMAAVGIGTPTPVNDLDVAGAMAIGATYAGTNAAPTNGLIVEGHVGIGETSPLAKLHVQNVDLGVTSGMTYDTLLVENTDAQFGLYSNSSGSWGSGLSLAEVNAGVLVNKWGLVRQTGASGLMKVSFGTDANPANNTAVMTFLSGGNVGVGVPDPSEKLDTNGTARLRGIGSSSGTAVIADVNGKLWKQSSSLRYKHNIADLPSTGEAVLALRPVSFNWNSTGEPDIGVIAEEVEQVLPDLVIRDAAGQPDGVRYDKVALYLLGVVKDQREQITAQQDELADLRARLERIEAALGGQATPRTGGVR